MYLAEIFKQFGQGVKVKLPFYHQYFTLHSEREFLFCGSLLNISEIYKESPFWIAENQKNIICKCGYQVQLVTVDKRNVVVNLSQFKSVNDLNSKCNDEVISLNCTVEPLHKCGCGYLDHRCK